MFPTYLCNAAHAAISGVETTLPTWLRLVAACSLTSIVCVAQNVRPGPGNGGVISPPIVIGGGGGGGGGGAVTPPIINGGGGALPGGGGITLPGVGGINPTIAAPTGVITGVTATASVTLGGVNLGGQNAAQLAGILANATFQWSISGGRITSGTRSLSVDFIADTPGTVGLAVTIGANGTSFNPSTQLVAVSAESAGAITAPATIATNVATLIASVPAAQNGDRTFRWTISGDGSIAAGQGTARATFRPGSPGLKQIVCNVNLQNLVTVPVRAYLVVTGAGAPTLVTVDNGSGGGTFPAGSRVELFAYPPQAGQVFDRWTGDVELLGAGALAATQPRVTITVPPAPVRLTATYRSVATWSPTHLANFNPQSQTSSSNQTTTVASTLSYHVPTDARGLVFLLHDSPGSGADWFERPEQLLLSRDLVGAGYGVAALASTNRAAGTWTAQVGLANNLDARNHAAALDTLVRAAALRADQPVFFVGLGSGGTAAVLYANLLATTAPRRPVKGAVLYLSSGDETLAVTSHVPQLFALAANDDSLGATGLAAARDNAQLLVGRGVATAVVNHTIAPVYPARFRTIGIDSPTFTADDAQSIWTAVKNTGVLDSNNYLKSMPTVAALTTALPPVLQARAPDVAAQLAIASAERAFFSDANVRVIDFLDDRVSDARVANPGRMVNLSARTQISYLGDTVSLGFNISGTQRATLLVRGVGPGLGKFNVSGALAAPRLEVTQGSRIIAANEGWERATNAAEIATAAAGVGAFALDRGAADAALLLTLDPGTYVASITGLGGTIGEAMAEIYDISRNGTRLTNLSVLGKIMNAGEVLIPGIVIAGNNPRTLMVRAVGPGLTSVGAAADSILEDPRIMILNAAGQTIANNNNWSQGTAAGGAGTLTAVFPAVGAFPLQAASGDAALINALTPGNYTLQAGAAPFIDAAMVDGVLITRVAPSAVGSVLVEVYEVP